MPVSLPDVTLVAIDCAAHDLTRAALEDTLRQIDPAEVLIYSNDPEKIAIPAVHVSCDNRTIDDAMRVLWYEVPARVRTSHYLHVEWDGWVVDGSRWDPAWLTADYLGAPWWYADGLNVGNGGFSLRSADLARWVAAHPARYPLRHPEDDALCRGYRRQLEASGFGWGTQRQAEAFSFERIELPGTFGFHGAWNWPAVLDSDALDRRLALANDYVRAKPEWVELLTAIG